MEPKKVASLRIRLLVATAILIPALVLIYYFAIAPNLPHPGGGAVMTDTNNTVTETPGAVESENPAEDYHILVSLRKGQAQAPTATPSPAPTATIMPLSPEQVEALFERLPALPGSTGDQVEFKYPVELLPPPRPATTIHEQFPPVVDGTALPTKPPQAVSTPEAESTGALKVLRYAPEGEISLAPFVSITFNQPMVPLGTLADLADLDVPARLDPPLPGTWRWLGTKTLTFEYDSNLIDRLPKATAFTVTVPAGTTSANGSRLAETIAWKFSTPPVQLISMYPQDIPQPLQPLIFAGFDQRIDPDKVLETIQVYAANKSYALVLASQAEIDQDEQVSRYVKQVGEGRFLVFKARQPFPADAPVVVTVGPGTPSAEGPLLSASAQSFSFRTYAPLRILEHYCGWSGGPCPPLSPFSINFNNPLESASFAEGLITVSPEIPGLSVNLYGQMISISGETRGQTTYKVTVSGKIRDIFGQTLGRDQTLTFQVGTAEPTLAGTDRPFITLDPAAKDPVYSVYTINYSKLAVKIYSVQPSDWDEYSNYLREWRSTDRPPRMPGTLLFDKTISLKNPVDVLSEVDIELSPYLKNGHGQFIMVVEPPAGMFDSQDDRWRKYSQTLHTWVQVTNIGLDAYSDHSDMVVWATDLKTGDPLPGVSVRPDNGSPSFLTGKDGTARGRIPSGAAMLVATKGTDQAMLLNSTYYWGSYTWGASPPQDSLRWLVFDDRQMYRPGEAVHLKGWIRQVGGSQTGDVSLVEASLSGLSYQIHDAQGNIILDGEAEVNALGGFDCAFTIPATVNLGTAYVYLTAHGPAAGLQNNTFTHTFQIQEFRRPEFEVTARNETSGPYFAGGSATLAVQASYYAGGPLPDADVTWQVSTSPSNYSPPNWPDFVFGEWQPWWGYDGYGPGGSGETTHETYNGSTDANGTDYLQLDFSQKGKTGQNPRPLSILAEAAVMDVNRQTWASTTSLLVHPADLYIGLHSDKYFVPKGTPLKVDFIVTDLDGMALAGQPVRITAARLEWKLRNGNWTEEAVDLQECPLKFSQSEPATCSFETPVGGSYRLTAIVTDEQGRENQTRLTRWVSGGSQPPSRDLEQEDVTLIPDQQTYQPGDTAQILVQSPFSPAEGLLTVSRSGFLYTTRFQVRDGSTTLSIPIKSEYIPNLDIQVDLVGSAPRTDDQGEPLTDVPARPAFATAQLYLSIPPLERTLRLEVEPESAALEPGGETTLKVTLRDAEDEPVENAEMAVIVVDEAILALTNYQMQDPLNVFYSERAAEVESIYGRSSIVLANPLDLSESIKASNALQQMPGALGTQTPAAQPAATEAPSLADAEAGRGASTQPSPIAVRTDFNPLATFAPSVRTGSNGEAVISIQLPDNLTRYRIMVVAVDTGGRRFGQGESNLTARLPLMVRPSAPRFLNFGDKVELPVVVQNQTNEPMTVDVVVRAANLELSTPGLRVDVPANDRVEVRFPASTQMAGTARLQVAAVSGEYADAAVVELPVYTPATTEAFATYGVIDAGAVAQPVRYPTGVYPQYGGLEIDTASTALQSLTDAVLYLVSYPYECSEQLASRILAVAALRDVLSAFKAEGLPSSEEMQAAVERDIQRLDGLQNVDGGFPYWRRGFDSSPFNTIHVTHALLRAKQKGFEVPPEMLDGALAYLRDIEEHYPSWYGLSTRKTLSAYALYVRNLGGDRDARKAERLLNEAGIENLSMEAIGWLWTVIDNEDQLTQVRQYVNNHVVETAGAANFTTGYDDQTYLLLSSDRRTDAILLDALMEDNPDSDLIPKVVSGLLGHRTQGRWGSTQENVFVLLTLDRYFNTYEAETPDFVAQLWLGDTYAGSSEFSGRTTEHHETVIPMNYVLSETAAGGGTEDLILSKIGPGRLYYRLGLKYAPTDLNLEPLDMGFVVERRYEAIDDPADVSRDKSGVWHIRAGALVRVHLSLVADNRRYHVALVDPLPAGLEIVNPALSVSPGVPQEDPAARSYGWWWWGPWYEHQNLRDDRAEAFTTLLWDGVYEYSYYARATTPGTFIVPPAKAEEMYSPEVFGRSASDWVIVK